MLSSAPKKGKPFNDQEFIKRAAGRGPQGICMVGLLFMGGQKLPKNFLKRTK